jgi:hypothetical protein
MVKGLYSIFDLTAEMFSDPKPAPTDGVFTRMVSDMMQEGNNQISNHPEEFAIYKVAEWNELTGHIETTIVEICNCSILKGE